MKRKIGVYYIIYTLSFLFISVGVFFVFIKTRRSFIWMHDGYEQNFPLFIYMSEYYKGIIGDFISTGSLEIPMVDLGIGFGVDIISTLNFYVYGDPLLLFTVFFPREQMENTYHIFILLRIYLAGGAFSAFCFYHKKEAFSILVGSFVYAFCGYVLFGVIRHPHFASPMIYLPLLLIGAEQLLREKKGHFFTFVVFLISLTNFYFLYKLTIMAIIYGCLRFYELYQGEWKKKFLPIVIKGVFYYLWGISMSAVILLPSIMGFLRNPRAGSLAGLTDSLLHYELSYYKNLLLGFLIPIHSSDYWTVLNFAFIVPIAIVMLFVEKKRYFSLKCGFLICLIGLCIPYAGHAMNGFGYVTNRWVFALSFVVATIVVWMLPTIQMIAFIQSKVIIFLLVTVSLWLNAYFLYAPEYENYASEYLKLDSVWKEIESTPYGVTNYLKKDEFYRVSVPEMTATNLSLSLKFHGNDSYYSINGQRIYDYFTQQEFSSLQFAHRFLGLNGRTIAEALASTKYYIVAEGEEAFVPYGYKICKKIERPKYSRVDLIYENEYALPLGYTYDSYITYNEYERLSAIEKQQAMLQAAVIEEYYATGAKVPHETIIVKEQEIPFQIGAVDGINYDIESKVLTVEKAGGTLQLLFNGMENSEAYIRLEDFRIDDSGLTGIRGRVYANGLVRSYWSTSKKNSFDSGCVNYLINLGYNESGEKYCTLWFTEAGSFTLGDIEIFCLPMNSYPEEVNRLKAETLENVQINTNNIVGTINVSKNKILTLSIPYSEGWSAKVDGKSARLLEVNTMYMGIELEAGNHEIELDYCTPGIGLGGVVSVFAFVLMIIALQIHLRMDFLL